MQRTTNLLFKFLHNTPTPESKKKSEAEKIENEKLRAAVHEVGARVYRLTNHGGKKIRICVFGCQGEKGSAQKEVAALIEKLAQSPETCPHLLLILGDNFYNNGVESPNDPRIEDQYYNVYYGDMTPNLKNIPSIGILGNHDGNRHRWEKWESMVHASLTGEEAEIQQVMHTYLHHGEGCLTTEEKIEFYSQEELDYKKMPLWNMPYFYYSIIIPPEQEEDDVEKTDDEDNSFVYGGTQLFCLNSNTFVKDYLSYKAFLYELNQQEKNFEDSDKEIYFLSAHEKLKKFARHNQAAWLILEYNAAIAANRIPILAMHHPVFTRGRRAYDAYGDADIYLTPDELLRANGMFGLPTKSLRYNALIEAILTQERLYFKTCLAAHDHFLSYNKGEICQVVSGGGGGKLQKLEYFENPEGLGCYIQKTGVVMLEINKNKDRPIKIDYYTTNQLHLRFTSESSAPVLSYKMSPPVEKIKQILFACFERYMTFLREQEIKYAGNFFTSLLGKETGTHTNHDTRIMCDMMNYLNQPEPDDLSTTIIELHALFIQIVNKSETGHSLYTDINKQFQDETMFGNRSFQAIYEDLSQVLDELNEPPEENIDYKVKLG